MLTRPNHSAGPRSARGWRGWSNRGAWGTRLPPALAVLVVAVAALLLAAAARAQPVPPPPSVQPAQPAQPAGQAFDFKRRAVEGEQWSIEQTTEVKQTSTMTAEGMPPQQMTQGNRGVRKFTMTVLAARDGVPTSLRLEFDPACGLTMEAMGQRQESKFPLAGKTVTVTRDARDPTGFTFEPGQLDPMTQAEVASYLEDVNPYRPPRPAGVGQEWDADATAIARQFQIGPGDSVSLKCRLESVRDIAGRPAAEVRSTLNVTKNVQGMGAMRTRIEGVIWIDVKSGLQVQADLKGEMNTSGEQTSQTPDGRTVKVTMVAKAESESHSKATPLGGEAVIVAPTTPTVPVPPPPTEPRPGSPRATSYAGTFSDKKVTVELKAVGPGKYTGTVTLGDRKFPVVAADTGRGLEGTFESQGTAFPFTATLDESNDDWPASLVFKTGKTTYTLTRASEHPAGPIERIPLEPY